MTKHGLLPISLGTKKWHRKDTMRAYTAHLDDTYEQSTILIVDTPKRHNLAALENASREEADERIAQMRTSLENMLDPITTDTTVATARFSEWWDEHAQHNLGVLHAAYECDDIFRRDIDGLVHEFAEHLPRKYTRNAQQNQRELAEYLIEEFAGLSAMSLQAPTEEVYPHITDLERRLYDDEYAWSAALRFDRDRTFAPYQP